MITNNSNCPTVFCVWTVYGTENDFDNCVSIGDSHQWLLVHVSGLTKCYVLT